MACDVVVASGSARSAVEPQWHSCGLLVVVLWLLYFVVCFGS